MVYEKVASRGRAWDNPGNAMVALRALCAGERPRARWAGGLGKELFLRSLFAPDLPKELFRKVLSFWAPVWD